MLAIETHMKNENTMVKILTLYQNVNITIVQNNSTVDVSFLIIHTQPKKTLLFW